MLKNKLYVYGDDNMLKVPAHAHYGKYLLDKFQHYKDRDAIINAETDERMSFGELSQRIVDIALSLARIGVRKGDVVSICSEKCMQFIPTVLGIISAGGTFAPADVTCGRATILHRINLAKPKIMFCSPAGYTTHADTLKEVNSLERIIVYGDTEFDGVTLFKDFLTEHADVDDFAVTPVIGWEDAAVILYSSGTTGMPKGIPLTHWNFLMFLCDVQDSTYRDKSTLITREWYYTYGLCHTLFTLNYGSTVLYCPHGREVDFLEAIQKYKIQVLQVTPATLVEFTKSSILQQYDLSSIELMVSSSTTSGVVLLRDIKERFPNLSYVDNHYGMTEAGCVCKESRAPNGHKAGSVGCANDNFVFKVVDLNTREVLGPNQRGEICFKSPSLMKGYIGDNSNDHLDEDGFFKTGDVGYYDEEKYFFIVDRVKELIKFNSYQVAPAELEAVLRQHPSVRDAGVVGAPHPQYGQAPTAFVLLQDGASVTADELVRYVDTQVSPRMRLAGGVRLVRELPRVAGKLDRKQLLHLLPHNTDCV